MEVCAYLCVYTYIHTHVYVYITTCMHVYRYMMIYVRICGGRCITLVKLDELKTWSSKKGGFITTGHRYLLVSSTPTGPTPSDSTAAADLLAVLMDFHGQPSDGGCP